MVADSAGKRIQELHVKLDLAKQEFQELTQGRELNLEMLRSSNEELRSALEELETANEELKTSNEELRIAKLQGITDDNRHKVDELADLLNLLAATEAPDLGKARSICFVNSRINANGFTPKMSPNGTIGPNSLDSGQTSATSSGGRFMTLASVIDLISSHLTK